MAGALDRLRDSSLMLGAGAGLAARSNFAIFADKSAQQICVLIVDFQLFVGAKRTIPRAGKKSVPLTARAPGFGSRSRISHDRTPCFFFRFFSITSSRAWCLFLFLPAIAASRRAIGAIRCGKRSNSKQRDFREASSRAQNGNSSSKATSSSASSPSFESRRSPSMIISFATTSVVERLFPSASSQRRLCNRPST